MTRPDRDTVALGVAAAVAAGATCVRRKVGAVVVDTDGRIAGTGHNGVLPDGGSCSAGDCPRGRHYMVDKGFPNLIECACGQLWPCPDAVEHGSAYDAGRGLCPAPHAEIRACDDVDNEARLVDATLYVTTAPCDGCIDTVFTNTTILAIRWPKGTVVRP
ncbi:deaminase [Streptomyces sp. S1]|uniref:deaminase n=1 Tax=Streptomyces sp. S1 TaxID=718288 RepID=UPI003D713079